MSTTSDQRFINGQSADLFVGIVDNSISNLNTTLQEKLDNKLSILKNDLKKEFSESLSILKSVILERLLIDNKKRRKRLSWVEEEIENLYEHIYDLEIAVQGVNQQSRRNNAEISGIPLSVNDDILEEMAISMLNKIVDDPISPNEVEACHRIGGRAGEKATIIRFVNRKRSKEVKGNRIFLEEVNLCREFDFPDKTQIYINDNLNSYFKQIAYLCRVLKRKQLIKNIEIFNGRIKISTFDCRWIKVDHHTILLNLFPGIDFTN